MNKILVKFFKVSFVFIIANSIFLLSPSSLFASNIYDLSDSSNYNIRIDGAVAGDRLGWGHFYVTDVDNNGRSDLIASAFLTDHNGADSGSIYIILDSVIENTIGMGRTIDLADDSNYNLRIDGAGANSYLGLRSVESFDLHNDGKQDLLIGAPGNSYLYIIYNDLLNSYLGVNKVVNLSDSSRYNIRFDSVGTFSNGGIVVTDIDDDTNLDLVVGAAYADYNGRNDSGSVFILKYPVYSIYSGTGNNVDLTVATNYSIRIDGSVAGEHLSNFSMVFGDIDNDSKQDLFIGTHQSDSQGRSNNSYLYIIYNSIIANYPGVGQNIDLSNANNFSIRIDGDSDNASFSHEAIVSGDINQDNKEDLLVSACGRDSQKGAFYVFYNELISKYSGPGQILDTADTSVFNIRYDALVGQLGEGRGVLADFNGDNNNDYLISEDYANHNGKNSSGSVFLFYGALISQNSGTGQILSLGNSDSYSLRYDGEESNILFGSDDMQLQDLNGDEKVDMIVAAMSGDFNGRDGSGSIYIIYNFPHTISIDEVLTDLELSIKGRVIASNSVTSIQGVEYSLSNNFSGEWIPCNAIDGVFDSRDELYECGISSVQEGSDGVYIRSYDENGSYTLQSDYSVFELEELTETGADILGYSALGMIALMIVLSRKRLMNL